MTSGRKQSGSIGTTTEPAQGRFSTDIISWDGNPMGVRMESLWDLFVSGIMQKLLGQVSQNSVERWRTHGNFKRNFVPFLGCGQTLNAWVMFNEFNLYS